MITNSMQYDSFMLRMNITKTYDTIRKDSLENNTDNLFLNPL